MGFWRSIFGSSNRLEATLNPLLAKKLEEFAIVGVLTPKCYFRFKGKDKTSQEFIVIFDNFDGILIYSRTLYRAGGEPNFGVLSEGPWSIQISYLANIAKRRFPSTLQSDEHLVANLVELQPNRFYVVDDLPPSERLWSAAAS